MAQQVDTEERDEQPAKTPKGIGAQLTAILEEKGVSMGELGRRAGYADHSHMSRVLRGRADDHAIVRIAEALDCEVRIVPRGTPTSVLGRVHEANERELRAVAAILDLLIDFRDDEHILEQFERDIGFLRDRALRFRSVSRKPAS